MENKIPEFIMNEIVDTVDYLTRDEFKNYFSDEEEYRETINEILEDDVITAGGDEPTNIINFVTSDGEADDAVVEYFFADFPFDPIIENWKPAEAVAKDMLRAKLEEMDI